MSLADLVTVNITALTKSPTQPGFGTPLIAASKVPWQTAEVVRTYNSLVGMTSDGFLVSDPAYLAATAVLSQSPTVAQFKVGKRSLPPTQTLKLTCTDTTQGHIYSIALGKAGSSKSTVTYTVPGSATGSSVATAIAALLAAVPSATVTASAANTFTFAATGHTITASSGNFITQGFAVGQSVTVAGTTSNNGVIGTITALTSTVMTFASGVVNEGPLSSVASLSTFAATASTSTATITLVAAVNSTSGALLDIANWTSNFTILDATTDPGIATDLAIFAAADTNWYGLVLDSSSLAEATAGATWTEANGKLFGITNSDTGCALSSSGTDILSVLKTNGYARSWGVYAGSQLLSYTAAAEMGKCLPLTPGSETWAYKTLAGVPADTLTESQFLAILGKNGNCYTAIAGVNVFYNGQTGAGEFIDLTRFVDWLQSTIQIRVFGQLVNSIKIPYTDVGVAMITSTIDGALRDGVIAGGLAGTPAPFVTAPKVAAVDSVNRGNRNLPNVSFTAKLAGAIHTLTINGIVSV